MIKDILDTHSHTLASGHAYCTLREMVNSAYENGMELLAITDHAPGIPGAPNEIYFLNFKAVRRASDSFPIEVLMGVEASILNTDGSLDLRPGILKKMDIVIASLHIPCLAPGTKEENTQCVLSAINNPYVDIIGHPDDGRYPIDYEKIVAEAKKRNVLLEVNNSSFTPGSSRVGAAENYRTMLELCTRYGAGIVMGSDAHMDVDAGRHDYARTLLDEINFPEELVMNTSKEKLHRYLADRRKNI